MKKTTFIGDIHGAVDDLKTLLNDSVITENKIVFLGDYIDGMGQRKFFDHTENSVVDSIGVLDIVMNRVNNNDDTALLGNHDNFWIQTAWGNEFEAKLWRINGGNQTWRQLGIHSSNLDVVEEMLNQGDLKKYTDFLNSLPLTWSNKNILAVHAGLLWDGKLDEQDRNDLMWIRDDYYFDGTNRPNNWHKNSLGKVIVTGHTPVQTMPFYDMGKGYIKMQADSEDVPRYLIDSGSRSSEFDGGIFALTLNEDGSIFQMKRAIKGKLFDGNKKISESVVEDIR
ncbi:metallophosphoesterase [Pediococcus argentinicus]|uniref:Diadenosine tetraphosphatase-like protein n=1 Tax=Pediococcus argentinicus TaxID=480391 RepID=A0A0R2NGE2_9LACO|nr:metallophosphoesterase [Pediococcus argentinicus]KRO24868.1 diadenosine tetraphosphatase-like protein [Pediococcus argentinicus]NKZ22664.1 serine/threonine protein phosphatase [Pediococcus argentinicus]GEP19696.1 serine/threonine protein phosphatase [Pediococcus argentinicus]